MKELQEMEIPDQKTMFICEGTIIDIRTDIGWKYLSCTTCKTAIKEDRMCSNCNQLIPYPRQRIATNISDETDSTKMVIFDKEAEAILGKSIDKMLDLHERVDGKQKVLHILQQYVGSKHNFKAKVGESEFDNERELKCQKVLTIATTPLEVISKELNQQKETSATISVATPQKREKRKVDDKYENDGKNKDTQGTSKKQTVDNNKRRTQAE